MDTDLSPEQALVLAINRIGGQAPMARLLDVAQPTVWGWLNRSDKKQLPDIYVLKVEAATRVSRHDLRPDLYPRGLVDDRPFHGADHLSADGDLVTDDARGVLVRDNSDLAKGDEPEWPIAHAEEDAA